MFLFNLMNDGSDDGTMMMMNDDDDDDDIGVVLALICSVEPTFANNL